MKSRFKLPVAHTTYRVDITKNQPKCDGESVQGYVNYTDRRIRVHRNATPEVTRAALWHEFVHGLFHELGREDLADDEALVGEVAQALMRVRIEQPEM